ncbi:hypothetical protein DID76_03265 [Candidatus Marinamargulisbacteria bacterium SCGC AG-414-C22]|nr:hypothetical protein DID76_03265 [Candidatus Marinamargulisbacteria bacterium SCGC AG-414-C22]
MYFFKKYFQKPRFVFYVLPFIVVSIFIVFNSLAMLFFTGGTYYDHHAVGYRFTENFFSDLGRFITYSGKVNVVSFFLFNSAILLVGLTFLQFFIQFKRLFISDKLNQQLAFLGMLFGISGSICMIGVALTPADLIYAPHNFFATWLFRFFFPATLCFAIALFRSQHFPNRMAWAYLMWSVLVVGYVLVSELGPSVSSSPEALIFQVTAQKIIVFTFVLATFYQSFQINGLLKRVCFYSSSYYDEFSDGFFTALQSYSNQRE